MWNYVLTFVDLCFKMYVLKYLGELIMENDILKEEKNCVKDHVAKIKETKHLTLKELYLLKKLITPDIDEKGKKVFVSRQISQVDLLNESRCNNYKIKKVLLKLKSKKIIFFDENNIISVTPNGLDTFIANKKFSIITIPVVGILFISLLLCLIFEITTSGMFFNSYRKGGTEYKFYINNYIVTEKDENNKSKTIEKGKYHIKDENITLEKEINDKDQSGDNTYQMYKYKNTLFFNNSNDPYEFPCEKISKGKYKKTDYDIFGSTICAVELLDDGMYAMAIIYDYGGDTEILSSGDYKLKNNIIEFTRKYLKDMEGEESTEEYTFYGVIKDDILYPNVFIKK